MNVTILGAGAMGSLFGGLLAAQGHAVELLDVNERHIGEIQSAGLTLDTDQGRQNVRVKACRPEQGATPPDWLIVFTKTLHTDSALRAAQHLIGPQTCVLSLQNGLGNVEKLEAFVPRERIAIGVTTVPADMKGPGHVQSHGQGDSRFMSADGQRSPALVQLAADFNQAGLSCELDDQVLAAIWRKVAFNAALNGICAVTGSTVGQLGQNSETRALVHRTSQEVIDVARAAGVLVDADGVHHDLDHAMENHVHHRPSMLQDLMARRPTEVDAINGQVRAQGERLGVPTPCVSTLCTLVKQIEATAS